MSAPYTFYTNPQSRGKWIRWVLEECGAAYDVVPVAYADPQVPAGTLTTRSAEFLAINPMGKRHGTDRDAGHRRLARRAVPGKTPDSGRRFAGTRRVLPLDVLLAASGVRHF